MKEMREQRQQTRHLFYRVIKYIGAYVAAMNGVDAIAFTAGVGENDVNAREKILSGLTYLGIEVDHEANKKRGENTMISTPASKVKVCVIPTNEELAICKRDCCAGISRQTSHKLPGSSCIGSCCLFL